MYFVSSVVLRRGSCFSTSTTWISFKLLGSSSIFPLGAMFFISTYILSPISGEILILLACMRPRSCGLRSTNTPKFACPCTFPSYILPTSSSRVSHSALSQCTMGFFVHASQNSPFVMGFAQTEQVKNLPLPSQVLHGSVSDIFPVPPHFGHFMPPLMSLP